MCLRSKMFLTHPLYWPSLMKLKWRIFSPALVMRAVPVRPLDFSCVYNFHGCHFIKAVIGRFQPLMLSHRLQKPLGVNVSPVTEFVLKICGSGDATGELLINSIGKAPKSSVELRTSGVSCFIKLWWPDDCSTRKTLESVNRSKECQKY